MSDSITSTDLVKQVTAARAKRYISHALVEIRRYKLFPFLAESAVLLDISTQGFKVEFTGEVEIEPKRKFWLSIPLSPLGIISPAKLVVPIEIRWFDGKRFRVGGTFQSLSNADRLIIEKILASIRSQKIEG